MPKHLYVFDLDETLINADCAMLWHKFLVENNKVAVANFIEEDERLMALYAEGKMDMQDYLDFSILPLRHLTTEEVHALAKQCVQEKILPHFFPEAKALIQKLQQEKQDMLIISASVSFLVEAVAKQIGIKNAIGIDLVVEAGRFTSKIEGVPSYQEGKVTRLKEWKAMQTTLFDKVHFYTDSINDLPLCLYADYTYLVNPCFKLAKMADKQAWITLAWGGALIEPQSL